MRGKTSRSCDQAAPWRRSGRRADRWHGEGSSSARTRGGAGLVVAVETECPAVGGEEPPCTPARGTTRPEGCSGSVPGRRSWEEPGSGCRFLKARRDSALSFSRCKTQLLAGSRSQSKSRLGDLRMCASGGESNSSGPADERNATFGVSGSRRIKMMTHVVFPLS